MDRESAYISDIPAGAEGRVTDVHEDGAPAREEFYLEGELVGVRFYHETGEPSFEMAYRGGVRHGREYRWDLPGKLLSMEPYENGLAHGTACQWDDDGVLIGTYTMEHGTGIDLWRSSCGGPPYLSEVFYLKNGRLHGFEWWLRADQKGVWEERHWIEGEKHGIERRWNERSRLKRGYPKYWLRGGQATKRRYLRDAAKDPSLPPYRPEDDLPQRSFPPEIEVHLRRET